MQLPLVTAIVLASVALLSAQERKVPSDSTRISIPGCATGRSFIVSARPEHEPIRADVESGRRFRLSGPRSVLNEIRARREMMLEVTGLVRKSQLSRPAGISIAGGRIRIGGALPRDPLSSDPARDPLYDEVVLDVESWRPLQESCPG